VAAERKDDGSPVTLADRRAEAVILKGLAALAPGTPAVAEEETAAGRVPETGGAAGGEFFLVDPLDGTKEFLRGAQSRGEFTVNIALVRDGVPVVGAVHAPALGKLWVAGPRHSWAADIGADGKPGPYRPNRVRAVLAKGITALVSRSHRAPETDDYLQRYAPAEVRASGSSLKFCVIAEGGADLYPRLGPTMEWDTAAGDAVLRAAGGRTLTLDGAPLAYGKRARAGQSDFANPSFVALGRVELMPTPD
jgi:3'(2'),5'-bisphosphate nucleotidase